MEFALLKYWRQALSCNAPNLGIVEWGYNLNQFQQYRLAILRLLTKRCLPIVIDNQHYQ